MTNNKAREINPPIIEELINETTPEELTKIDAEMTNNKQQTAVECQFEIDTSTSSATKCKFCGKEKWQHINGGNK